MWGAAHEARLAKKQPTLKYLPRYSICTLPYLIQHQELCRRYLDLSTAADRHDATERRRAQYRDLYPTIMSLLQAHLEQISISCQGIDSLP
jgi:hypothetical protein